MGGPASVNKSLKAIQTSDQKKLGNYDEDKAKKDRLRSKWKNFKKVNFYLRHF